MSTPADDDLRRTLATILERLDGVDQRLARLEHQLTDADRLRAAFEHERDSRRALADQLEGLADRLGRARDEVRWLRGQRNEG